MLVFLRLYLLMFSPLLIISSTLIIPHLEGVFYELLIIATCILQGIWLLTMSLVSDVHSPEDKVLFDLARLFSVCILGLSSSDMLL